MTLLETMLKEINLTMHSHPEKTFCIVIDGDAAAGKSTLGKELAQIFNANLVSMDSFYLPFNQREDCSWCHMDFKRLVDTVLNPFQKGQDLHFVTYNPHDDCVTMNHTLPANRLLILEGSYSYHPLLRGYVDISFALSISENTQRSRIINRSSLNDYERFKAIWIPKEKAYQRETKLINSVTHHIKLK